VKVWFTRPSLWDCLVKGIGRCELWFVKPYFDKTPRGDTDLPAYAHFPRGWRALCDDGLDIRGTVSIQVGDLLDGHPEIARRLWDAVKESVEGPGPHPDEGWAARWKPLLDADQDTGDKSFLLELELPPQLWFRIALHNGFENGTWPARHFRYLLDCGDELPF
jgi:hypothetical protein